MLWADSSSWSEAVETLRWIPNSTILTQNIVEINDYMKNFAFMLNQKSKSMTKDYIYNFREEEKVFTYIIFNFYSSPYILVKSVLLFINEILLKLYYIFLDSMNEYAPLH